MINVSSITQLQQNNIAGWHTSNVMQEIDAPFNFIQENNYWNFMLWHEEDKARIPDIEPLKMVEVKRNIDRYNQLRNNAMEKIDEWILMQVNASSGKRFHSETPGMMIDRLSILQLKHYHTHEQTIRTDASKAHIRAALQRLAVLAEQVEDLGICLQYLFEQLALGELKFKVYRQLKMYNDPAYNPELYNRAKEHREN